LFRSKFHVFKENLEKWRLLGVFVGLPNFYVQNLQKQVSTKIPGVQMGDFATKKLNSGGQIPILWKLTNFMMFNVPVGSFILDNHFISFG
jgi:hypothetical protein